MLDSRNNRRRPGGRTAEVTERVTSAVLTLLVQGGINACTFQTVAKLAEVERSTLYRRYSDRWEMIIDAFITKAAFDVTPKLSGSFAKDLRSVLTKLFEILETPLGPALIATAAELRARSGSDYSRAYFDRRMAQLDPMFDAAVDRGELPKEVDREALFTFAAGSIYFRMFIAARGVDGKFITTIVDHVRRIYGAGA